MTEQEVRRLLAIIEKIVDTKIQKYALRDGHLSPIAFEEKNMVHYTHGQPVDHILFRKFLHEVELTNARLEIFDTLDERPDPLTADTEKLYFVLENGSLSYIVNGQYVSILNEEEALFTQWKEENQVYLDALLSEQPENPKYKFINALREWIEIAVGGGGYQAPLYFTGVDSITAGFKQLNYIPQTAEQELPTTARNETKLIRRYVYDQPIGITTIDSGNWVLSGRYKVSSAVGVTRLKVVPFLYHLDGETTELFTSYSDEINNTEYLDITKTFPAGVFHCLETDRLGVDIYIETTSNQTLTFTALIGDGHPAYFVSPLRLRHNQLRGLNDDPNFLHITQELKDAVEAALPIVIEHTESIEDLYNTKADWNTTLSGYGITDTYTKTEIDSKINLKYFEVGNTVSSQELVTNTAYKFTTRTNNLVLTLGTITDATILNVYYFIIDTGSTLPSITWPDGIIWYEDTEVVISINKHYEFSIIDNVIKYYEV